MTSSTIIANPEPLQPQYIPSNFIDRDDEQTTLNALLTGDRSQNIHVQGPRGTGKTHLLRTALNQLPSKTNTCYIDCRRYRTEYQAFKQIYHTITGEPINDGYHTSDLQRKIEDRTGDVPTVIVLDEIDFLLHDDGDDLLYSLSRIKSSSQFQIVTISAQSHDLDTQLEERTRSSLQPYSLEFQPYTGEDAFQILLHRAQNSLTPQSLQQAALTYIASTTQNIKIGLHWLKTVAQHTDQGITEQTVQRHREHAYTQYAHKLLDRFTEHHRLTYQATAVLFSETDDSTIQTGDIYQHYQELCENHGKESLSNRRISDYLKHLELLELIRADYHYGGTKGKTREIQLTHDYSDSHTA